MNVTTLPEVRDLSLREQLAQRGIESSAVLQQRYNAASLAHWGRLRGRPMARANIDAVEVVYLNVETIALAATSSS
jgi:hypothetical protein